MRFLLPLGGREGAGCQAGRHGRFLKLLVEVKRGWVVFSDYQWYFFSLFNRVSPILTLVKRLKESGLKWFTEESQVQWYHFFKELTRSMPCPLAPKF